MIGMSNEQKSSIGTIFTLAYRTFVGIILVLIFKAIPIFIYDAAKWQKDIEDRTLTSVEMRIDLERHMAVWTKTTPKEAFDRLIATETAVIALKKADSLSAIDRAQMRNLLAQIERNTRK